MKKILLTLALTASAIGILSGQSKGGAPVMPKPVVSSGTVTESDDLESRRYTGQVVSQAMVQVVPRVSGEILEVGFADGSAVKEGQLLYRLDPLQYEAAVKRAEANIAECRAKLEYAQNNFDRNQTLYRQNAASKDTMENTRSAVEAYQAALEAAKSELVVAQDNLKNTRITAPHAGLAGVSNYTSGNYITPSSGTLVTLIQVKPIRVRFALSTADLLRFGSLEKMKAEAEVRLKLADGSAYPTTGKVEFINNEVNRKTDAILVYAAFPNDDLKLLPGSTVGVLLSRKEGAKQPSVPPSAVMYDGQGAYVYVLSPENRVEKRYISCGNSTPERQLVTAGLKVGERIVTKGTHKALPGAEVEAVEE